MRYTRSFLPRRTKEFALAIVRLYTELPPTVAAEIIGKQVFRSATSVGAHVHEGKRSRSVAEMISKTDVALQELEETIYWLELLTDSGIVTDMQTRPLIREAGELNAMLSSSSRTLKLRQAEKPVSRRRTW